MESWELHVVARRYLAARYDELVETYAGLPDQGRTAGDYSDEAKRIYPRYNAVAAMLEEVERLDPDDLPELDRLAADLAAAAFVAQSPFTKPPMEQVEAEVIEDERLRFRQLIPVWMANPPPAVVPMKYRRVLRQEESADWRRRLEARWGLVDLCWHPQIEDSVPEDVLVLRGRSMWDGPGVDRVREALRGMGRLRVVELREYGADRLLDVEGVEPRYTLAEGVWTDETLDWIAYASHEGTIAFGGTLAAVLPSAWPDIEGSRW
ncbi:hypothetical protein [Actinokineospora sp. NPDC004072]